MIIISYYLTYMSSLPWYIDLPPWSHHDHSQTHNSRRSSADEKEKKESVNYGVRKKGQNCILITAIDLGWVWVRLGLILITTLLTFYCQQLFSWILIIFISNTTNCWLHTKYILQLQLNIDSANAATDQQHWTLNMQHEHLLFRLLSSIELDCKSV